MIPPELKDSEFMRMIILADFGISQAEVVRDTVTGHTYKRDHPVIQHDLIFRYQDRIYQTEYTIGMGEAPELPFEFEDPVVVEVEAVEVTRTEYRIKDKK
jgi:hypothetical protein